MLVIKSQAWLIEKSVIIPGVCVNWNWNVWMGFTEIVQQRNELHIKNNVVDLGMLENVLDVIYVETRYCKLDKMRIKKIGPQGRQGFHLLICSSVLRTYRVAKINIPSSVTVCWIFL